MSDSINIIEEKINNLYDYYLTNKDFEKKLLESKDYFYNYYNYIFNDMNEKEINKLILEKVIRMCNDIYVNSVEGEVLLSDREYDELMNLYIDLGGSLIVFPNHITQTIWDSIEHKQPCMVGTISNKIYDGEVLYSNIEELFRYSDIIISPKYDGISVCIEIKDKNLISAITRGDGKKGLNITRLILEASNIYEMINKVPFNDGFIKCEILMKNLDFLELQKEFDNKYKNRRSAVSGICNAPKNLLMGKYLTIMPLIGLDINKKILIPLYEVFKIVSFKNSMENVMSILSDFIHFIRQPSFQYRVDGIICMGTNIIQNFDEEIDNIMDESFAYKLNTQFGLTKALYIYPSVGRTGRVTPMVAVEPVEVNETIVTNVSLSNLEKMDIMRLHENQEIEIMSAGDVIPMVVKPEKYNGEGELLKMPMICPYCEKEMILENKYVYCRNENCIRVKSGKIVNFLDKIGVKNVSDAIIDILCSNNIISKIEDLLQFHSLNDTLKNTISSLHGFGEVSANNIITEIETKMRSPITCSNFFGSLGIDNISEKKCKLILRSINHIQLIKNIRNNNLCSLAEILNSIKGIKKKTVDSFINFCIKNKDTILTLYDNMKIISDINSPIVVCTGFRDKELEDLLILKGYQIDNKVTKKTNLLIFNTTSTTNYKLAEKYNIKRINLSDINSIL